MSQGYQARHDGSPGSVLAAARDELNLSVGDVARHLKLSPAQVEALETGAYERLPGRVFVRGFLRNYAKLLGLDPQPLLRGIESQMPQPALAEERPSSTHVVMPRDEPARWPLYTVVGAALVVLALAVYEFGFNEPQTAPREAQDSAGLPAAPESAAGTLPLQTDSASAEKLAIASAPASGVTGDVSTAAGPLPGPASPAAAETTTAAATKPARAGERGLYFRFDEESWVEVRDRNDRVIFSKLNSAGSEERVSGMPPLKLIVGNARGVHLTSDEQPVDLTPHTGVSVARLTLQ